MLKEEKIRTTINIDKKVFLKFKSLCALKELKLSDEIENLIRKRIEELE